MPGIFALHCWLYGSVTTVLNDTYSILNRQKQNIYTFHILTNGEYGSPDSVMPPAMVHLVPDHCLSGTILYNTVLCIYKLTLTLTHAPMFPDIACEVNTKICCHVKYTMRHNVNINISQ